MTTTYQVSDKIGDKIVLIKAEHEDPGVAFGNFGAALSMIGNAAAEATLRALESSLSKADPLAVAVGTVQAAIPAQVTQVPPVYAAAGQQEQWGNPPVPAFQPAQPDPLANAYAQQAPQVPAAAAKVCQHGTNKLVTGNKNGREWRAWGCPAPKGDPSGCGLDFIRG